MIPYGRQTISDDDVDAVVRVLRGDWLTQGPAIAEFEEAVVATTGARRAVAFSNGTAALHAAAAVAGLGPGDRVATSPLTFMASANCIRYVGASVVLVDIEPETLNLDPAGVGADIDALVAVHYAGLPFDLSALTHRPRVVIEDAAQALGALTPDGPVGNCARSEMCCFSFHPVKPITTAEGGIVTTNSDLYAEALRRFRSHGIAHRPERGGWYYEIESLGYNYRLTDMQAALGSSQMPRLEAFIAKRAEIATRYDEALRSTPYTRSPRARPGYRHGYHLYVIRTPDRERVYQALRDRGIGVQVHYVPVHHHPIATNDVLPDGGLPNCDAAYEDILSLPIYPSLTSAEQEHVIAMMMEVLR